MSEVKFERGDRIHVASLHDAATFANGVYIEPGYVSPHAPETQADMHVVSVAGERLLCRGSEILAGWHE